MEGSRNILLFSVETLPYWLEKNQKGECSPTDTTAALSMEYFMGLSCVNEIIEEVVKEKRIANFK